MQEAFLNFLSRGTGDSKQEGLATRQDMSSATAGSEGDNE
jgi:hypothetical protein